MLRIAVKKIDLPNLICILAGSSTSWRQRELTLFANE